MNSIPTKPCLSNHNKRLPLLAVGYCALLLFFAILAPTAQAQNLAALPHSKPQAGSYSVSGELPPHLYQRPLSPAKQLFGHKLTPADMKARAFGSYARGCLAGGQALPVDGPHWQVMRLSRHRNYGHPELIAFLNRLAKDAPALGWNGLLVGDMAQPRGGPMLTGHASHQIGLDVDIWLKPMPKQRYNMQQRESVSAISMLKGPLNVAGADRTVNRKRWTDAHARLIRRAAQDPKVARIFVNPVIKKALCEFETGDRHWLRKVRPWWGHHYHFHVRMSCPKDSRGCVNQAPPPLGDGCGTELTNWLSDAKWVPKKPKPGVKPKPRKPKPPMQLDQLPKVCAQILAR
ncbi:penicillin-insensitive murein endopeptidase [Polycladidibacter stylochi]|uniref:penicillin-insensitive murein endopeptidase n=1 Tax=Polycladidibacter stylochi TaxID=1807766 RepID=UPI0009EA58D8|nr:penicillin-insensitive murein endopeptidase [Pseudovibrio stylochi]